MTSVFFLMSFLGAIASAQTNESFSIDVSVAVFTTHPNYLSFTVDMVGFVHVHSVAYCLQYYLSQWDLVTSAVFGNEFVTALTSHLSPAFFRSGVMLCQG